MKQPRIEIHGTKAVFLFLAIMSSGTAGAALLDFLKSPSNLIMNQKDCTFMKRNNSGIAGETVNGKFIFSPSPGLIVVLMSIEKLDDNRVVARMETAENRQTRVLDVKKSKGAVTASITFPQDTLLFLECTF